MLFWNPDKTSVAKPVFKERLSAVLRTPQWIIDGNYASTMELRMEACDTVIFLDYPTDLCLQGVRDRKGKARSDMPWFESDQEDEEFIQFIKNYNTQSKPQVLELLNKYYYKNIFVFTNRTDADAFLANPQHIYGSV